MSLYNKLKWILGILIVFVLIIATNLIDKNNFTRVRDSVVTIYEDRIIASDLIFELQQSIHEKEVAIVLRDSLFYKNQNSRVNQHIESLLARYDETKLTKKESKIYKNLKSNLADLITLENKNTSMNLLNKNEILAKIDNLKSNLSDLSKVQLDEGGKQMSISKKALDTVEFFTQLEICILVVLAIVIQLIVMYNPKKTE
ncbi:MCP four helix bundle domain-containing protein [Nonlabens tegetincola]|uniref:MCP four helix bundle domain-containing protein n=1 Tax=Nonlabens tegetincola TaxID=323273 RepID=UPI000CF44CE9|nr:MCP four helix bundle domain-containing protein [Nonlabens tegetincola]PQJ18362.1 chemotaxis protein [Nonlabens tegetincola]